MPHVLPAFAEQAALMKIVESKQKLQIAYRSRRCNTITVQPSTEFSWKLSTTTAKPRYIIVGLQTGKLANQQTNPSIFDHCDLKNMYVMLNEMKCPAIDYNLSFPNQQFSRAYKAAAEFTQQFYGMHELISQGNITPSDFKDLYPLMVFDVSHQSEQLKNSNIDVNVYATFNTAVPAGTQAYALTIGDSMIQASSDGISFTSLY